jgi:hypothetical protein
LEGASRLGKTQLAISLFGHELTYVYRQEAQEPNLLETELELLTHQRLEDLVPRPKSLPQELEILLEPDSLTH